MKEPIEELFKQSLGGHEMPYNPDAWTAMNARLNVASPVAAPTSYLKYYLGAAVIGVAAITTYIVMSSGNTPENTSTPVANETTTEQTTPNTTTPSTDNNEALNGNTTSNSNSTEAQISSGNGSSNTNITQWNSDIDTQETIGTNKSGGENKSNDGNDVKPSNHTGSLVDDKSDNGNSNHETNTNYRSKMTMPSVDDLCLNEETIITNPNGREIYLLDGLNTIIKTIPANKSVIFKPTVVGNYSLGYKNDTDIESSSNFVVNRIPDSDFTIDLVNKYENGLPSTHVQAIGGQGTYTWKAMGQSTSNVEADVHFYKKGDQTITLTVDNGQCTSSVEKSIYIEQDYNLMSVNSFTPLSTRPENTTFIPFALTQRNVNFVLTIIDGRDGGIVYQTSDASLPWDGTDIRSGRRSQTPQVYVWKAVILNPSVNEPSEYRGTITMN